MGNERVKPNENLLITLNLVGETNEYNVTYTDDKGNVYRRMTDDFDSHRYADMVLEAKVMGCLVSNKYQKKLIEWVKNKSNLPLAFRLRKDTAYHVHVFGEEHKLLGSVLSKFDNRDELMRYVSYCGHTNKPSLITVTDERGMNYRLTPKFDKSGKVVKLVLF